MEMTTHMETDTVIELDQVSKRFKDKQAVNKVSFRIPKGSIVAILGPNGAGKTTAINMLLGLLEPTEGTVRVFGRQPGEQAVREQVGAMLQEVSVMDRLKAREIIALVRSYYPNPASMEELLELTGFGPKELETYAEKLSGGQKRSLSFALALAGNPQLLFFDEPTVGLDIGNRRRFWTKVQQLAAEGKTILFTTHYLQEADDYAERILLFDQGQLAADGTPTEIKQRFTKREISFQTQQDSPQLRSRIAALPGVAECYAKEGRIYMAVADTDAAMRALILSDLPVYDLRTEQGKLDDAFDQLTLMHQGGELA
jgi:ABC-2 type transport system ATP-binding protein